MNLQSIFISLAFMVVLGSYTSHAQSQTTDSDKIKRFITKKRDYNKRKGFGYRIQLYNGSEDLSKAIRTQFQEEFPTIETHLIYNAPEWKIQVGNYKTTLEADKAMVEINLKFSGAIVIPIGK
ncbi:SPOR domain-containing protein [Polaribacter sp. HL-MS24]|uniref:SPOR domain-containing protein n=1 Tax=Polaribacter sp. HL-MS24 TaxID=3077735 RepID=UPI0029350A55|nr:SPOR domain-containing protein [Polaribacter sp. HL-MS24]WOC40871.1 SPOR domain-containing protein [Polaribacter sp. HL-MS24]